MDESEHCNAMAEEIAETSIKKRPRKKHLYSQILQQMEFYFSDANLSRDRFLSQLLQQNKNVPLEIFLRFNKIRALTGSTEEIAKALGTSQLLKITEDGKSVYRTRAIQKKENQDDCIIYVEQLPPDANHDWVMGIFSAYGKVEYVSIPKYKNRAAIKGFAFVEFDTPEAATKALEAFGSAGCCLPPQMPPEELCSIATFETGDSERVQEKGKEGEREKQAKKHKKKNKNSCTEEAGEGFEQMHEANLAEAGSVEPKAKKLKIETGEQQVEEKHKKKKNKDVTGFEDDQQETVEDSAPEDAESIKTKKGKKRKMENENTEYLAETKSSNTEEGIDESPIKKKKRKKHLEEKEIISDEREDSQMEGMVESGAQTGVKSKKKKKFHQVEDGREELKSDNEELEDDVTHDSQGAKKKSKKKKRHEVETEGDADKEIEDADDEGSSKRTKKQTNEEDKEEEDDETGGNSEKSDKKKRARKRNKNKKKKNLDKKENDPTSLGLRIISKNEWRRLRNKYLNLQREKMQALKKHLARAKFGSNYQSPYPAKENGHRNVKQEPKTNTDKTEYVPGVIIHIDLAEPLGDVNAFKRNARSQPGVIYVDATEGDSEVHIRCTSAEVSQKLIGENLWDNMKVLEGETERAYWEKIEEDRKNKVQNRVRVNVRGRDKLLKRAERELGKHIKFDD